MLVLVFESFDTIKDDELDVVIGLFDDEVDECAGSGFDSSRILGEDGESGCCLVFDDIRSAVEQFEDGADVSGL